MQYLYQIVGLNFIIVVAAQFLIFLLTYLILRPQLSFAGGAFLGILLGLPYGFFVDLFVGLEHGIFNYYGQERSWLFLMFNWLLSYGFFISSVFCYSEPGREPRSGSHFLVLAIVFSLASLGLLYLIGFDEVLPRMIILGVLMVSLSEILMFVAGQKGYLEYLLSFGRPAFRLWFFVAATGLSYEAVNFLFPLWHWKNDYPSEEVNLALIAFFGYAALVYPVVAVKALLFKHKG